MFFNSSSTYPIGLDISDLSLKLVQLNKIRGKIKIQALGKMNLPKGIIESGLIKKESELINAIKELLAKPTYGKVSSEEIIACLPEAKTFIKLITIEKSPNPIAEIIGQEIEKHIPLALDEIYFDWQIIENLKDKYLILVGAAPKTIVNQYTELLDKLKLSVTALEIESVSICRSLLTEEVNYAATVAASTVRQEPPSATGQGKNYAIIDIGANHTAMIFYSKNTILLTVSLPLSGEQITANIAQTLELTPELAEKAKIICGLDEDKAQGVIKNVLADTIEKLTNKIKEALEFYNRNFADRGAINQILLCGSGANIKNLAQIIQTAINIEVKIGDSLINLAEVNPVRKGFSNGVKSKYSEILSEKHTFDINSLKKENSSSKKTLSITQDASLTFSTAIGLALRGIYVDEI